MTMYPPIELHGIRYTHIGADPDGGPWEWNAEIIATGKVYALTDECQPILTELAQQRANMEDTHR